MLVLLLITQVLSTPLPPLWPDTLWQNLTISPASGSGGGSAVYYFYSNQGWRLYLTGFGLNYCGSIPMYSVCIQTFVNQSLYINTVSDCCICCNEAQGCSFAYPADWMKNA